LPNLWNSSDFVVSQAATACTSEQRWEEAHASPEGDPFKSDAFKNQEVHFHAVKIGHFSVIIIRRKEKKKLIIYSQHNIVLNLSQ